MFRNEDIKSLFHQAVELPEGDDPALWLRARCNGDQLLFGEVWSLLEARLQIERNPAVSPASRPASLPNADFGPYRAIELIGRGGTSTVYRAQRADGQFEQIVALKIMAGYLAGGDFLRRFETERQLLAYLNHEHITRLLDGGVSSAGDPYLVTEFVEGQTIDRYCDELRLPVEDRLRIFLQVCEAVEYAHRNLIVHRDLKPGNILVNREGSVKLLDFGTASLAAAGDDVTVTSVRMLTPRYASPEQLRGERVNTATDVFSLGVVLYELLTGAWPFGDPGSVLSELGRLTGDVAAKAPSTAVSEQSARLRALPRPHLSRVLQGDIAPILLRALDHEPGRRYESVRQFAADIENYLAGRPVLARAQTRLYRARKFLGRRWLPVSAAMIFVLGLSAAAIVAVETARTARAEAVKSGRISQFLKEVLASGTGGRGATVEQMLDAAEPKLATAWQDDPLTEAALRLNLGASYTTLQRPDRARTQEERALSLCEAGGDYRCAGKALWVLGLSDWANFGHLKSAAAYYERALASLQRSGEGTPRLWDFRIRRELGSALVGTSWRRIGEGRSLLESAVAEGLADSTIPRSEVSIAQAQLGEALAMEGRESEAESWFDRSLEAAREPVLRYRTFIRARRKDPAGAAEFANERYRLLAAEHGAESFDTLVSGLEWAHYRAESGQVVEALAAMRKALPPIRRSWSHGNDWLWYPLRSCARILVLAGQFDEAERYARESLEAVDTAGREDVDWWRAESLELIGAALAGKGHGSEAVSMLERSEAMYRALGPAWAKAAEHVAGELRGLPR